MRARLLSIMALVALCAATVACSGPEPTTPPPSAPVTVTEGVMRPAGAAAACKGEAAKNDPWCRRD